MAERVASGSCRAETALKCDVGAKHEEMVKLVCRLLRMSYWLGLMASTYHVFLCLFLYASDVRAALTKLLFGVAIQAVTVYASVMGKSWVFELQAIHLISSASQCAIALSVLVANAEWTMHDIAVMLVTRPLLSLSIMCSHSVLDVVGNAEPNWMLVATCAAINVSVLWKVCFHMPSFVGVAISAIVLQLFVGVVLKSTTNALLKERDVLKLVTDGLQQHVDSQDSMWKSVFDATLLCDSTNCVVSASAQAVDLLQFEAADALVGQAFISLAAPEEQSRISGFLRGVVSSPSSQAMTIQGTFLPKGHQTPVELQINAVRVVQNIYDSSEGAFGILIGARLVEAPREERPAAQPDDTPSQEGVPEGPGCPGSEDMWIAFDAGTQNFSISDCSPGLCLEDEQLGLLRWVPPMARNGLETWVVDEVAACGELGSMSSSVIERFHLRVPAAPARSIVAEKAWLEVKPTEVDEDEELSLPAVLWLRGVACQQWQRPSAGARRAQRAGLARQQLTSILEDGDGDSPGELAEQQSVASSDELTPSDSVSEQGLRFRIQQRGTKGSAEEDALEKLADQRTAAGSEARTPSGSASDSTSDARGLRAWSRG